MENKIDECCPKFEVTKLDKKHFIKETVPTLFHIPFPPTIGKKMTKMFNLAQQANANITDKTDALVLFHDPSAFKSEIYYSVTKEVEQATNTTISGSFIAKVFEGPYNAIPKFIKEMEKYLSSRNQSA